MNRAEDHHLTPHALGDNIHIILVRPRTSANIGAVARAMKNFGFFHLHLVAPYRFEEKEARATACWADDILSQTIVHHSLEAALSEMNDTIGFTSSYGKNRSEHIVLDEWKNRLEAQKELPKTALIFGPEDTGLTSEDIPYCRLLVRIATHESNPSLNLAQAVLIVLYELTRTPFPITETEDSYATGKEYETLCSFVHELAQQAGFYSENTPQHLPDVISRLIRRTNATEREMQIMLGVAKNLLDKLS